MSLGLRRGNELFGAGRCREQVESWLTATPTEGGGRADRIERKAAAEFDFPFCSSASKGGGASDVIVLAERISL